MKKVLSGFVMALILIITSSTTYAADTDFKIKVDGFVIASVVKPEIKNNRVMVPLRVISENLGAKVNWSNSEITLTKSKIKVTLKLNSSTAVINGKTVLLDVKPFLKNNHTIVPLRFISEAFGCTVNYKNSIVTVDTEPLVIDGIKVKALQQEYHMTMGGVEQQIKVNAYYEAIYSIFVENKGSKVEAPVDYSWQIQLVQAGAYYKNAQYDFLDQKGKSIKRFDIYSLMESYPPGPLTNSPKVLLYDDTEKQWYLFSYTASQSINQLMDTASMNGFLTIISNTVA